MSLVFPPVPESGPIGIFGGTFDPVHYGHLRLAEEAAAHLGLSQVRWLPAGQPPHRETPQVTSGQRLEMVRLATAGNAGFEVDAAEVEAAQPSYSVLTLTRLRALYGPDRPLVWLLGADAFAGLTRWHRWRELLTLGHLAVSHRPGFPVETASLPAELADIFNTRRCHDPACLAAAPAGRIVTFAMTQLAISATQIRNLLLNGGSVRYLLPPEVIDYIAAHQLYRPC